MRAVDPIQNGDSGAGESAQAETVLTAEVFDSARSQDLAVLGERVRDGLSVGAGEAISEIEALRDGLAEGLLTQPQRCYVVPTGKIRGREDETSSGPENAPALAEQAVQVPDVLDDLIHSDQIERLVSDREGPLQVGQEQVRVAALGGNCILDSVDVAGEALLLSATEVQNPGVGVSGGGFPIKVQEASVGPLKACHRTDLSKTSRPGDLRAEREQRT